ncbi:MAG: alkaline phosphatase family protein [Candidatus Korobacteraceae bacterium]
MARQPQVNKLVLLVQVDALRHDYINEQNSPFIAALGREGFRGVLEPTFGFEPDGAYLAGLYPDECDGGAHYWRHQEQSPFRSLGRLSPLLNLCPEYLLRRVLVRGMARLLRQVGYVFPGIENIPFSVIANFAPVWRTSPFSPTFRGYRTLFSICAERGIAYLIHAHPANAVRLESGFSRISAELRPPTQFAFWHIGDLDTIGHRNGPLSAECRRALRNIDARLAALNKQLRAAYEGVNYVVFGDHGMAEVTGIVDVAGALRRAGIVQGKGLLYFLDSTMARFWFQDEGVKDAVIQVLGDLSGGTLLTQKQRDDYHLNYPHDRFGELIFLADPGRLVSPNYFQGRQMVRGMHGYAPECPEQQSALVMSGPARVPAESPLKMTQLFPTVLEILGLGDQTCAAPGTG